MRRSQAPSQIGASSAAKRPRISSGNVMGISLIGDVTSFVNHDLAPIACTPRSLQGVLELLENNTRNVDTSVSDSSYPRNNYQSLLHASPLPVESVKQYNVFWCKASAKKHKNWEEEAILVVRDRDVTLKDMEGKEIGKAAGYKLAQLQDLQYGTILKVGGREILIQDQIFTSPNLSDTKNCKISNAINPKTDVKSSFTSNYRPPQKARNHNSQDVPIKIESSPKLRSSQDVLGLLENNQKNADISLLTECNPAKSSSYPVLVERNAIKPPPLESLKQYSVFWCKASAKKHKNWEEEAILTVKDRGVILKSMEGKEIGQATGFKFAQLRELEHGSILKVGGREVLIQNLITDSANTCGIFSSHVSCGTKLQADGSSSLLNPLPSNKEFVSPFLKAGNTAPKFNSTLNEIKPRYNPSHPSALVMPRPPTDIQWKESQRGTVIVDVVVDPLLSKNLRPHQRDGVVFLYECLMGFKTPNMYGAILADEMGLGKTLQCITLIWILLQQGPYNGRPTIQRVLIVTPSSLVKNWEKEFRRWLGRERINVFTADQQNRPIEYLKRPLCPVMVVSYEMLVRCFDEVQQVNFDLVVCDEGHRLKNAGNKTSSLLSQLDTNRKVLLTGTPVQNDLKEFFTLADFVNPGILGSLSAFRRIYEEPIIALQQPECDENQREVGEGCASELAQLTSQFVLRRTQEVMNAHLPPKVESVIFCKPTYSQIELYRSLLDSSAVRSILSSTHCGNDHLSFILALRKLCNHPTLFIRTAKRSESKSNEDDDEDIEDFDCANLLESNYKEKNLQIQSRDASGKFVVTYAIVDSVMKNTKEKIILVSYSTKMLDMFGEACTERNYSFLRLDGSTPTSSRMGLVDRFNDPQGTDRIFLLSSKAGGVGLNLIGASRLILYDIDWNPANDMQAMARVWREGQKRKVKIYRLLTTGTIEEKIFQRQILKQGLSGTIVDARDCTQGHFTKEELKDLFTLREDTNCDTHDLIDCPCIQKRLSQIPPDLDDYDFDDERDCQLGAHSSKKNELHKTVDQLMDWEHFGTPFLSGTLEDVCLESALEDVSFIFRCASGTNND